MSDNLEITLTIVRHGQTYENKLKTIQGQKDTKLTQLGIDQAKQLARYFSTEQFDTVYASDLSRALDTCKILAENKYKIVTNELLRERRFGVLEGLPIDKLREEAYKAGYDSHNFTRFAPSGGESMEDVQERISKFCKDILATNAKQGQHILIVTHGGVIREFMKLFRKFSCNISTDQLIITPNTAFNRFKVTLHPSAGLRVVSVISLHNISHLESEEKSAALQEEQLNDASSASKPTKEEEHGV